ncbi:MAG TPA: type IV toxin-antitoxin system AbiEi family antitoxin domain-containing protein [Polyangia bacterium]|nr:type IV toxin-antitoxin system AbiEi family antitoxin domain-containing protein [Polyangia bacterium]
MLDLEWRDQRTVRIADLDRILGRSTSYARFLAHELVRKGWLERLRPGLFRLIPANRGREGVADTNPLAAGAALVHPSFFSFGTACSFHGLTEQVFSEVYIACQKRLRPRTVRNTRYVFIDVRQDRFFGFTDADVLGEVVPMATRERALLDAIDRPRFAGGLGEVSRIVARSAAKLSWPALLTLLRPWRESALVQRLGYLLDLNHVEVPAPERQALKSLVRPASKVHLGARGRWGSAGALGPWNVVENVPRDVLLEPTTQKQRRVMRPIRHPLERQESQKWTMPIRNWKNALNQFAVHFESRLPV